jgi:polyamine oxidase
VEHPEAIAFAVSRWWDDPWSRGAWSLLRPGSSPTTRAALREPIAGRLMLAGEATHPEQAGMTHGAYDEGRRAAQWAIDQGHRSVIVVGAGFAGLGAARMLHDAGVAVTVLEARNRLGGRAHTTTLIDDGAAVELGANWLQQGERNTLAPIAAALGLRTVDTDFGSPLDLPSPIPDADSVLAELERRLAGSTEEARLGDVVDAWLTNPSPFDASTIRRLVDVEVTLDAGVPLIDLSARYGFEPGVGEGDRWIVGGYRQIAEHLASGLDIRFDTPVGHIAVHDDGVLVDCHRTDAVIVTAPVAVLASGSPAFDPPLPESHRRALAGLTTGRVEKVALRFEQRFWPETPSGYLRITGAPGCVSEWLDLTEHVGAPTIVGIVVGPWLDEAWSGDDRSVAAWATDLLRSNSIRP